MLLVHHGDRFFGHDGWWWGFFGGLLPFLLLLMLVGVGVWAILRATGRTVPQPLIGPPAVARPDGALQEVRLRYARGELSREEYLQRSQDLGAVEPQSGGPPPPQAG